MQPSGFASEAKEGSAEKKDPKQLVEQMVNKVGSMGQDE